MANIRASKAPYSALKFTIKTPALFFLILAIFAVPLFSHADALYLEARRVLGIHQASIIDLPPQQHQQLQDYYLEIFEKFRLPTDKNFPQIFLVNCTGASAFVIPSVSKNHVFFCWEVFKRFPNQDYEAYVFGHELRHFDQDKKTSEVLQEYDADLQSTLRRILRMGLRDPVSGDPQDAPYSVEAIIQELKKTQSHSEDHMAAFRLAGVLEVAFGQERYKRNIPDKPTSRTKIHGLVQFILQSEQNLPPKFQMNPDTTFANDVDIIQNLISNNRSDFFQRLTQNIKILKEFLSQSGEIDYVEFILLVATISEALQDVSVLEDDWAAQTGGQFWENYFDHQTYLQGQLKQALKPLTTQDLDFVNAILPKLYELPNLDEVFAKANKIWLGVNEEPQKKQSLEAPVQPEPPLLGRASIRTAISTFSYYASLRNLLDALKSAQSEADLVALISANYRFLSEGILSPPNESLFSACLTDPQLLEEIFSRKNEELAAQKAAIVLTLLGAAGSERYNPSRIRLIFNAYGRNKSFDSFESGRKRVLYATEDLKAWSPLLQVVKNPDFSDGILWITSIDEIFWQSWEGEMHRSSGNRQKYHFLGDAIRAKLVAALGKLDPIATVALAPLNADLILTVVDQLIAAKAFTFLFSSIENFFAQGLAKSDVMALLNKSLESWLVNLRLIPAFILDVDEFFNHILQNTRVMPTLLRPTLDILEAIHSSGQVTEEVAVILFESFRRVSGIFPSQKIPEEGKAFGIDFNLLLSKKNKEKNREHSYHLAIFYPSNNYGNSIAREASRALDSSLMAIMSAYYDTTEVDEIVDFLNRDLSKNDPAMTDLKIKIEQVLKEQGLVFLISWLSQTSNEINFNEQEFKITSILDYLVDWDSYFSKLGVAQILALNLYSKSRHSVAQNVPKFTTSFVKRTIELYRNKEISFHALLSAQLNLMKFAEGSSSPALEELIMIVLNDLNLDDPVLTERFVESIQPSVFQSMAVFVKVVAPVLIRMFHLKARDRTEDIPDRMAKLKKYIKDSFGLMDPMLANKLLEEIASSIQAPLRLKNEFVAEAINGSSSSRIVEGMHIWSQVFERLSVDNQFLLIQFVRGIETSLTPVIQTLIRKALRENHIFLTANEVESYLRRRFKDLAPAARTSFFHVALSQPNGVLTNSNFRMRIYDEILGAIGDPQVRKTFLDLWTAGIDALPAAIRSVVLSIAISESSDAGSPEKALLTLFKNMGPLSQKLGQSLALVTHLPESFRKELEKLWDEAQELTWWQAWELIKYQHGDIEKHGYFLSRIMNAGTTEATLEITHRDSGRKFVISVYRDGINRSVQTDTVDLRKFVENLTKTDAEKYGFLNLLVEDNVETIGAELDRNHKRNASLEMSQIYKRTGQSMGGVVTDSGFIQLNGFNLYSPSYFEHSFGEGKKTFTQELAQGVPLKELLKSDPEEYKRVSAFIISFENAAMKNGEWIDKDRMPGQYLYDRETRTIYILDHGQARKISRIVLSKYQLFMALLFNKSILAALKLYEELVGIEIPEEKKEIMNRSALKTDSASRPLHVLDMLSGVPLSLTAKDSKRELFIDLVHAVRAKLRLGHWEASLGLNEVSHELTQIAKKEITTESVVNWVKSSYSKVRTEIESWFNLGTQNLGQATRSPEHPQTSQATSLTAHQPGNSPERRAELQRMDEPFHQLSRGALSSENRFKENEEPGDLCRKRLAGAD